MIYRLDGLGDDLDYMSRVWTSSQGLARAGPYRFSCFFLVGIYMILRRMAPHHHGEIFVLFGRGSGVYATTRRSILVC